MPIEYLQPIRSEYDSEVEYATALLDSVRIYKQKLFQAIDRSAVRGAGTIRVEAHKPQAPKPTIHDYLVQHPSLLKRYREIGPLALLELD